MATKCDEKTSKFASKLVGLLTGLLLLSLTTGCEQKDTFEVIKERGTLRVVTRLSPTTYYRDNTGHTGFEYQLAVRLADHNCRRFTSGLRRRRAFGLRVETNGIAFRFGAGRLWRK